MNGEKVEDGECRIPEDHDTDSPERRPVKPTQRVRTGGIRVIRRRRKRDSVKGEEVGERHRSFFFFFRTTNF